MPGTTFWERKNGPRTFTANTESHSSGVTSASFLRGRTAALLTRMSIGPKVLTTAS